MHHALRLGLILLAFRWLSLGTGSLSGSPFSDRALRITTPVPACACQSNPLSSGDSLTRDTLKSSFWGFTLSATRDATAPSTPTETAIVCGDLVPQDHSLVTNKVFTATVEGIPTSRALSPPGSPTQLSNDTQTAAITTNQQSNAGKPQESSLAYDLGLNLTAEIIGMILTIGFVDRLIRRSEDRKWNPIRNLLHASLLELVANDLLFWLVPARHHKISRCSYQFGTARADLNSILTQDQAILEETASLSDDVGAQRLTGSQITRVAGQLDYVVRFSSALLEAELLFLLMQLHESLRNLEHLAPTAEMQLESSGATYYSDQFEQIVSRGIKLQSWLMQKGKLVQRQ